MVSRSWRKIKKQNRIHNLIYYISAQVCAILFPYLSIFLPLICALVAEVTLTWTNLENQS